MKDSWLDFQNDFADALDPLHLDDELFGDGDGYTDFGEMMASEDEDIVNAGGVLGDGADYKEPFDESAAPDPSPSPAPAEGVVTLTLSVSWPPRKAPTTGMWRYFNESPDYWDFNKALLDAFPELIPDYEGNTRCHLADVITETYEIDKPRGIAYLRWIWANFPVELFEKEQEDDFWRGSWESRGEVVLRLIDDNPNDNGLCKLLKSEEFLHATFEECLIDKHTLFLPQRYIFYLLRANDFAAAKEAYDAFLAGQKGRYGPVDLGKMWDAIVLGLRYDEKLSDRAKATLLTRIRPLVAAIGVRGEKVCKKIEKYLAELKEGDE